MSESTVQRVWRAFGLQPRRQKHFNLSTDPFFVEKVRDIHLVVDNYATHKHPKVRRFLGARPRFHVHSTPTYSSWLNQVEIWFNIITQQAIRRGTFRSVKDLVRKIDCFVSQYNDTAKPFAWAPTADSILQKIERLCQEIASARLRSFLLRIPLEALIGRRGLSSSCLLLILDYGLVLRRC